MWQGQKREAKRKARRKNREPPALFPFQRLSHRFSNVDILTESNTKIYYLYLILNVVVVEEEKNRNVVLMDGVGGGSGMKIKIWQGAKYLKRRKVGEGGWCK